MIKFQFNGNKVTHNAHELILDNKLSVDEVCEFVTYYSKLGRWWGFHYNSNQPVEIIVLK